MVLTPPPTRALLAEWPRGLWTIATLPLAWRGLGSPGAGDGRPVMLLPGLFNSDRSNVALKAHLNRLGYRAEGWGLGRNLGARTIGEAGEQLFDRVERLADASGEPVTLIGISLGGIMARLAAHRRASAVRSVITIASPYAGSPRATNVWRLFQLLSGQQVDDPAVLAMAEEVARPLPVPATAIWSASDGLVNGHICRNPGEPGCRAVEVASSHIAAQFNPQVLRAVAQALASDRPQGAIERRHGDQSIRS